MCLTNATHNVLRPSDSTNVMPPASRRICTQLTNCATHWGYGTFFAFCIGLVRCTGHRLRWCRWTVFDIGPICVTNSISHESQEIRRFNSVRRIFLLSIFAHLNNMRSENVKCQRQTLSSCVALYVPMLITRYSVHTSNENYESVTVRNSQTPIPFHTFAVLLDKFALIYLSSLQKINNWSFPRDTGHVIRIHSMEFIRYEILNQFDCPVGWVWASCPKRCRAYRPQRKKLWQTKQTKILNRKTMRRWQITIRSRMRYGFTLTASHTQRSHGNEKKCVRQCVCVSPLLPPVRVRSMLVLNFVSFWKTAATNDGDRLRSNEYFPILLFCRFLPLV